MLKGLGNLASLIKHAQEFQGRMAEIQESLGRLRVQGTAGGGMVTVEASGQQEIVSCRIDSSLLESGDRELLEDLLVAAVNQALTKAKSAAAEEMREAAGNVQIPGFDEALAKLGMGKQNE